MDSIRIPTPARVFQDFEPSTEWVPKDDLDTLLVYLPGELSCLIHLITFRSLGAYMRVAFLANHTKSVHIL